MFQAETSLYACCRRAEARGGLHIVEQSLWAAVPAYLRKLSAALQKHCGRPLPMGCVPVTFASWMGGDRDGNPTVTAKACLCCKLTDMCRSLVQADTGLARLASMEVRIWPMLLMPPPCVVPCSARCQREKGLHTKQDNLSHGA